LSPQKAEAIHQFSKIIAEQYQGEVPKTMDELLTLPGVGRKTASVVLSQAFHVPAFPVDTHIFRLAKRWGVSQGKNVKQVEEDLKKAFPKKLWNKLHLQMIYYGRNYCPARGHVLEKCPICLDVLEGSGNKPA
jgi:endonuclease-3